MQSRNLCPVEHSDDFHIIDFIIYVVSEPIDHQLNIQNTPKSLISIHPLYFFYNPTMHCPVEHSDDFYIIAFISHMISVTLQPIDR